MDAIGQGILNAQAEGKDLLTSGSVTDVFKNVANLELGGSTKALFNQAKQAAMQTGRKLLGGAGGGAGESALKALDKVRGTIVNPHKAVMYTGPGGFRTFSYNFTMVAKSQQEADDIADIVSTFKFYMSPGLGMENVYRTPTKKSGPQTGQTVTSGGGQATNIGSSLTLTYPSEWEIQMRVNKISSTQMATKNILFQIDTCYLEGCDVDYATGGVPAFFEKGSKPQTTTMGLTFKETAIMTKEKINQGF
ncbi:MAG: hypothetical protein VYE78_05260 [Candidatus Thermoplasmatota archaeon]|nr:hypothetical protein [Candidatus Thermoplasmatota archaeon]